MVKQSSKERILWCKIIIIIIIIIKTWDVDVNIIFVSTLIETKNCSKYLIGYLLSKVSGYVKTFEEKDSLK